jgi:transcriptional regulator with XRE-family HTH domain
MDHVLHAQLTPVISIDGYSRKHNFSQSKFHHTPAKRGRNRGVVLSGQGWQKLMQAGALYNELGERYTYEQLSERSHLDERTVSRLLSCEVRVDKNTLRSFFRAFNLSLEAGDYTICRSERTNDIASVPSIHPEAAIQRAEFEQIVEELTQLKQQLREYDRLFHRLGLKESYDSFSLSLPL